MPGPTSSIRSAIDRHARARWSTSRPWLGTAAGSRESRPAPGSARPAPWAGTCRATWASSFRAARSPTRTAEWRRGTSPRSPWRSTARSSTPCTQCPHAAAESQPSACRDPARACAPPATPWKRAARQAPVQAPCRSRGLRRGRSWCKAGRRQRPRKRGKQASFGECKGSALRCHSHLRELFVEVGFTQATVGP